MLTSFGSFSCLLLCLRSARAALTITVPEDTIQAKPGSDILLPCFIEDSSGHINLDLLAVIWRVGSQNIAKYEDTLEAIRPGAKMSLEELQKGNASLLLPDVRDTDSNIYSCFVIHSPDSGKREVELRVEVAPHITLGSTKVQLAQLSNITCTAADFYPGNVSVTWFRNNETVQGPESPPAQSSTESLFRAESVLKLKPEIADANANFSCQIHHQATKEPLIENFQLQVQAHPTLHVLTVPSENTFAAALCQVSGFYPPQIHIQWLQNGVPQPQVKSQLQQMQSGKFSIESVLFPRKSDAEVTYVCRAEHEALDAPLEQRILWQTEDEGDRTIHPTLLSTQNKKSWPTVTSTAPPALVIPWLLGLIIGVLLGFALGAGIMYYKYKAQKLSVTVTPSEETALQWIDEEKGQVIPRPKTEDASGGSRYPEAINSVQEQQF